MNLIGPFPLDLFSSKHDGHDNGGEDFNEDAVTNQDHDILPDLDLSHRVKLENIISIAIQSRIKTVYSTKLIMHESFEWVSVESDVINPDEVSRDVRFHDQETLTKHEHSVETSNEGHADDIMRDK